MAVEILFQSKQKTIQWKSQFIVEVLLQHQLIVDQENLMIQDRKSVEGLFHGENDFVTCQLMYFFTNQQYFRQTLIKWIYMVQQSTEKYSVSTGQLAIDNLRLDESKQKNPS